MFRILVVDDNPLELYLLDTLLKTLSRPYQLDRAQDGAAALELLRVAPLPDLILMDMNMPRLNGLQTLIEIKNDPELRTIPVIMLSTSAAPTEVRKLYEAHANSFVEKPATLERSEQFVRAIETFWMDFAVRPPLLDDTVSPRTAAKGPSVAMRVAEVGSRTMSADESVYGAGSTGGLRCEEHRRLMEDFAARVKDVLDLHQQQFEAAIHGDPDCNRFDLLIHMASERKQQAKYDYLRHVESHGCSNLDVITHTSGT